jgi:hypothetical protein
MFEKALPPVKVPVAVTPFAAYFAEASGLPFELPRSSGK